MALCRFQRAQPARDVELTLLVNGATGSVLNVHLKSGCSHGRLDNAANDACMFLQHQAAPLEA
jgi:hypothetical protein